MTYTHEELTARLKKQVTHSTIGKLNIINKEIPFQEGSRGLDPRVKRFLTNEVHPNGRRPLEVDDLEITRNRVEVNNKDLSSGIRSETTNIFLQDRAISMKIYNRTKEKKPVIIYFHGGGFFERDVDVMENVCKFLAQKTEAVVVAVEYRLAPEHPYQDGLNDCFEAVRYVYENARKFNVEADKMGMVGDSVGGNFALGVHHLSTDKPWTIGYIGMFCPLVDLSDVSRNMWNIKHYDTDQDSELIRQELVTMKESLSFIQTLYLTNLKDVYLPLVSPLLRKDKTTLPPITLVTAEFDFLRIQGEEFSTQLAEAGVPVRHFKYKGMDHAFVRKLGYYPQAADAIIEVSNHFTQVLRR
ncbi:alpha/beta hydrolase [Alkalicoccus halolimnae]|uniref:Alpha/beta hydrolase n=1 Tax=Alkalicoccus halolimnae TaxID=1667239 RepID=A0A5C7FDL5_9BACI|nr:alpha/beta hydrolase [Alkalicoccus halolimnae]TXF83317.1 alpha/beta hydrolase [Alkalicoccus halolimnae]